MKRKNRPAKTPANQLRQNHRLRAESLEERALLAADLLAWHNADLPADVDGNGLVTSRDALMVINSVNTHGSIPLTFSDDMPGMVDVNGDEHLSAGDALQIINTLNGAEGEDDFMVRIRLDVTPIDSTESVTQLGLNEPFLLRGYVQDLTGRETNSGVFGAYLDITYSTNLADVVGAIQFVDVYSTARSGDTLVDGLIDEVGASDGLTPLGLSERLMFSIPMTTEGIAGALSFSGDPADDLPAHETLLFGINDTVAFESIDYAGTTVTVSGGIDPVVAVDDQYNLDEDNVLEVDTATGVLANDMIGDGAVASIVSGVSNGNVILNPDGSFQYTPNANFNGTDSFTYSLSDGTTADGPATVTLNIAAVNDVPVSVPDAFEVAENETLNVPPVGVLANDSDVDGDTLSAILVQGTGNGTLTLRNDGSFDYQPNPGFVGNDFFTYTANDGLANSLPTQVTITVTPINQAPTAENDSYSVVTGNSLVASIAEGVLANDTDPDGDPLEIGLNTNPANGVLQLNDNGSFTYTPNAGFVGTDTFLYVASDGDLGSSPATVTIEVTPEIVGDPLVAIRLDTINLSGDVIDTIDVGQEFVVRVFVEDLSDTEPVGGVFAAYLDITYDPTLASAVGSVIHTSTYPNGTSGNIATPGLVDEAGAFDGLQPVGPGEILLLSVPMRADAAGLLEIATDPADLLPVGDILLFSRSESIDPSNVDYGSTSLTIQQDVVTPIVAADDAYTVPHAVPFVVDAAAGVLANDTGNGQAIVASLVDAPDNGSLTLNADGSFTYDPVDGFSGTDTFTYQAVAGEQQSNLATVTLTVEEPTGDAAAISGQVYFDVNNDGVRQTYEHPVSSVAVRIAGAGGFTRFAQTDRNGQYSFADLPSGEYVVTQFQPTHLVDGIESGVDVSGQDEYTISVVAGEVHTGADFAEFGLQPQFMTNRNFFLSAPPVQAAVMNVEGERRWFSLSDGWEGYQSIGMRLSADRTTVTINAVSNAGVSMRHEANVYGNRLVRVTGNDSIGYLIELLGSSAEFDLQPVTPIAAAVDQIFATA